MYKISCFKNLWNFCIKYINEERVHQQLIIINKNSTEQNVELKVDLGDFQTEMFSVPIIDSLMSKEVSGSICYQWEF